MEIFFIEGAVFSICLYYTHTGYKELVGFSKNQKRLRLSYKSAASLKLHTIKNFGSTLCEVVKNYVGTFFMTTYSEEIPHQVNCTWGSLALELYRIGPR